MDAGQLDAAQQALSDVAKAAARGATARVELGALRLTAERVVRAVNPGFEAVSGIAASLAIRADVFSLVQPEDAHPLGRALADAEDLAHSRRNAADLPRARARTRAGRPLVWTIAPEVDGSGRLVGFSAVVEDVSATEHAADLAERARPLLDGVPDLVGVADDRGTVVYLNAAARAVFGVTAVEPVSIERVFAPAAFDQYYREIRPALLLHGCWQGIVPMRRADGREFRAWQSVTAGVGPTGDTIEWLLSIGRDVASLPTPEPDERRARLETELQMALDRSLHDTGTIALIRAELDGPGDQAHPEAVAALDRLVGTLGAVAWNDGRSFAGVVEGLHDVVDALRMAERVRDLLATAGRDPATNTGTNTGTATAWTASAGTVVADRMLTATGRASAVEAARLVEAAEVALARAQAAGGDRVVLA